MSKISLSNLTYKNNKTTEMLSLKSPIDMIYSCTNCLKQALLDK